uniref:DUF5694 domain-containing protein n=1 Tax=Roseihalotalea indica TaxID=2867963 RepID=A0AA49JEB7_9BACT|nr:DUF5694 domain-containing protein [Tunicatimonas sp. TK19036]
MAHKTKILLLGTIHFDNHHDDEFNPSMDDIYSVKRQAELEALSRKLGQLKPAKIFVEWEVDNQKRLDDLYQSYLRAEIPVGASEIYQIGFRLARQQQLARVLAIDNKSTEIELKDLESFAKAQHQMDHLHQLKKYGKKLVSQVETLLQKDIAEMLALLNSEEMYRENNYSYVGLLVKIGAGKSYPGAEMVADWFRRNLLIYNNILRLIERDDRAVIIILGYGHMPVLRFLFSDNLDFEVLNTQDLLSSN